MKRKPKAKTVIYPETGDTLAQIKEDAAAYGLRRDVLGVREAKDQMSSLLQRAAGGEEIVITSGGVPKAMIVRYRPIIRGKPWESLRNFRATQPMQPDSKKHLNADREERC
jgi:prevent-host-death family protein|uniref:type II toxin-antitoxin system Phd/YefM family antitoxin n=1 Tax=Cephaloticoccus sp. TaxID=1985742 RepID=UPI00404A719B